MEQQLAPIALFAYNRAGHLQRTLEALSRCDWADRSHLIVFSDGPRTPRDAEAVRQVRKIAQAAAGFADVKLVSRSQNFGLARSIITGVSELCLVHGRAIVLEDDLVVARGFLGYMNQALERYRNDRAVMQVSGYVLPMPNVSRLGETFLCRVASSWGWATWERAWSCFNPDSVALLERLALSDERRRFDVEGSYPYYEMLQQHAAGTLDVWGVRWYASMFLQGGLCLYPDESLVQNIGMDGSGMHCNPSTTFDVRLSDKERWSFCEPLGESGEVVEMMSEFFRMMRNGNAAAAQRTTPWIGRMVHTCRSLAKRVSRSIVRLEVV